MSASLVGSEMCIRDRPFASDPDIPPPRCAAPLGRPEGHAGHHLRATPTSVSYTHLTLPTICSV
eukprot:10656507-Alexandrium_andersonii.AAC.1